MHGFALNCSNSLDAVREDRRLRHPRCRGHHHHPGARPRRHARGPGRADHAAIPGRVSRRRSPHERRTRWAPDAAPRGPQRRDPDRAQARVDQDAGEDGARVPAAAEPREERGAAHRLPGGRLPEHLRVLGGPRGDLPHRRLAVHAALRLLPDRHRQARRLRRRRTAPGRRIRRADAAALLHRHGRRPRRPPRRGRVAVRGDDPRDPPAVAGHRRRDPRHRLLGQPRAPRRGVLAHAPRSSPTTSRRSPASSSGSVRPSGTTAPST